MKNALLQFPLNPIFLQMEIIPTYPNSPCFKLGGIRKVNGTSIFRFQASEYLTVAIGYALPKKLEDSNKKTSFKIY